MRYARLEDGHLQRTDGKGSSFLGLELFSEHKRLLPQLASW
jgi:hypothetical protein